MDDPGRGMPRVRSLIGAWIHTARNDRLVQFIIGATIAGATWVVFLIVRDPAIDQPTIQTELTKASVQLTVVALGAAVVAAIVKGAELNRESRERRTRDQDLQSQRDFDYLMSKLLPEVTDIYNRVKLVRRNLSDAHLQLPLAGDQKQLVSDQMEFLSEAQLDLEALMRAVRVRHFAFRASDETSLSERLTFCLRQMEGYANEVRNDAMNVGSSKDALMQFLGKANNDGGIRRGGKIYPPKPPSPDDQSTWNGPAASLRQIEDLVAGMVPEHLVPRDE